MVFMLEKELLLPPEDFAVLLCPFLSSLYPSTLLFTSPAPEMLYGTGLAETFITALIFASFKDLQRDPAPSRCVVKERFPR